MTSKFEQLPARPQAEISQLSYDRWLTPNGEIVLSFYRLDAGFLLRFPERADFLVTEKTNRVVCTPAPDICPQVVTDLYFNQVVPLLLNFRGELVLHGSAVLMKGAAVAFIGQSGRGKSTLAATLSRNGFPFLTDDGLLLTRKHGAYIAHPNRPYLRLRNDSRDGVFHEQFVAPVIASEVKNMIISGTALPYADQACPLGELYILGSGESDNVVIEPLVPASAFCAYMGHSFILDVEDKALLKAHFGRLADLAQSALCFTLDYPRRYEFLPEVSEAIILNSTLVRRNHELR